VNTITDIPSCNISRKDLLVYIIADKKLQYCDGISWIDADLAKESDSKVNQLVSVTNALTSDCVAGGKKIVIGKDNDLDGILSLEEISSTNTICNGVSGNDGSPGIDASSLTVESSQLLPKTTTDVCTQFTGEQCLFMGGSIVRFSDGSRMITGDWDYSYVVSGDTDLDAVSKTFWVTPNQNSMSIRLHTMVARGSGYGNVWLVYTRSPESFKIWHDATNNGPDTSDTLLHTITPIDF
jgi:hypothetical protein